MKHLLGGLLLALALASPVLAQQNVNAGIYIPGDPTDRVSGQRGGILTDIDGRATIASSGYSSSVTITRPNDTAAYTARDVIGASTGSTAGVEFTNIGPAGSVIAIIQTELLISATALIASEGEYELHFYSVTPPSALGDNAAWDLPSGDRASYLGYTNLGTPVDEGSSLYFRSTTNVDGGVSAPSPIAYVKLAAGSASLFAYLVPRAGYTPTANRVYKVTLYTEAVQ